MMRVAVGGISHETNTFASSRTTLEDFRRRSLLRGPEIPARLGSTRTEIGGMLNGAAQTGLIPLPLLFAGATPSGLVTADTFQALSGELLDGLRSAGPVEGVLVVLHGAMVAAGCDDPEGDLLTRMRETVGSEVPIIATLDLHANISPAMVEAADVLIAYDTYPHVDPYERGVEAATVMGRMLRGEVRPRMALCKPPLLPTPQGMMTARPPMRDLVARAHEMEADPHVISVSVAGGFPYADIACAGMSFVAVTDGDAHLADTLARELADVAWERRREMLVHNTPVQEAVRRARAAPAGPVILVDVGDNVGGGSPGDGTVILEELLQQGAKGAVIAKADAEVVEQALAAGVGGRVEGLLGGKTDGLHGEPVPIRATVRLLSDGRFVYRGSYMTGQEVNMGRTAVLEADGVTLVVSQFKTMPFDQEQLRSVGITPEAQKIIVVKAAIAWRAAYQDMAAEIIEVETPGVCANVLSGFTYRKLKRPVFPLDPL